MVEDLVEEIGYEMQGRIKVHYVIPILTMSSNGLRPIRDEHDIAFMVKFVDMGHHFFSLYLDHGDSVGAINWDDMLHFPVTELHAVITPSIPRQTEEIVDETPIPTQIMHLDNVAEEIGGRREGLRSERKTATVYSSEHHAATSKHELHGESSISNGEEAMSEEEGDPNYEIDDSEYDTSDGERKKGKEQKQQAAEERATKRARYSK
jgi:hypothetical protein